MEFLKKKYDKCSNINDYNKKYNMNLFDVNLKCKKEIKDGFNDVNKFIKKNK